MALNIKCSLFVSALLCAGVAGFEDKVPNGQGPFSIGKSVSPLEKVISVITDIRDEVVKEGETELAIYKDFSCFCKDKSKRLTTMVNHHARQIDLDSAGIADKTADSNNLNTERQERQKNHETFSTQLDENEESLSKETANWQNTAATFSNDKHLIKQALASLKDSKKGANAFLQVSGIAAMPGLSKLLQVADTMGLITLPKHRATAASLLQLEDGKGNPMESYGYHGGSDDIIDLVEEMWGEMQTLNKQQ